METTEHGDCTHSRQMKTTTEGWVCEDCFQVMDATDDNMSRTIGPATVDTEMEIVVDQDRRRRKAEVDDAVMTRRMNGEKA